MKIRIPAGLLFLIGLSLISATCTKKENPNPPGTTKDLTTVFIGSFNGTCTLYYKHPSFFVDTIPVASINITQIDSSRVHLELLLNGTQEFKVTDTAFPGQVLRLRSTTPTYVITDSATLKGDSLYLLAYHQDMTTFAFIGYQFAGKR